MRGGLLSSTCFASVIYGWYVQALPEVWQTPPRHQQQSKDTHADDVSNPGVFFNGVPFRKQKLAVMLSALRSAIIARPNSLRAPTRNRVQRSLNMAVKTEKARSSKRLTLKNTTSKDVHLLFDSADLTVRGGNGGRGAIVDLRKQANRQKLRKGPASGTFEMPPGGSDGGDVILVVDPALSDLMHLRSRKTLVAPEGGDSLGLGDLKKAKKHALNTAEAGTKFSIGYEGAWEKMKLRNGANLMVPVPPGTFVRTSKGQVLGDLVAAGQQLVVAKGGRGGPCVTPEDDKSHRKKKQKWAPDEDVFSVGVDQEELKKVTLGECPKEVKIELILRTVADVGFVGYPNAGKSTLLRTLSRAVPEVQPYPFTTLMPNLGGMISDDSAHDRRTPVLADLPGLIDGAHKGKGLGKNFLRHLRRVSVVLYILDSSSNTSSVGHQYSALRDELRMYNPRYLERPHIVAINKLDVPLEQGGEAAFEAARKEATDAVSAAINATSPPVSIVPMSALRGKGIKILKKAIDEALKRVPPQS